MIRSPRRFAIAVCAALMIMGFAPSLSCAVTDLNDIPMVVSNNVKANFLVVLDNSQSMDALMGGALQPGDNPETRGNIGRKVLRDMFLEYRSSFKWGLMSFDAPSPSLRYTSVYYMGDDVGMVFTDVCVAGISATNGKRCVENPQPFSGGEYVTYDKSSDDPEILDVLYDSSRHNAVWAVSPAGSSSGSTYDTWFTHIPGSGTAWAAPEFTDHWSSLAFTPTDAGFVPSVPTTTRQLYLPRGWGYRAPITGGGKLSEAVLPESVAHYDKLIALLAAETDSGTPEIKNGALYTPLAGTFDSAKNYFAGQADWRSGSTNSSPIEAFCQKNFVMLLTDGLPTGNKSGGLYSPEQRTDSCSAWSSDLTTCTGNWTFGSAARESFAAVEGLRSVSYAGCTDCRDPFDVQTYVVAMGTTVDNARAVAVMNEMARLGTCKRTAESCVTGGEKAYFATDAATLNNSIASTLQNAISKAGAAAAVAVTSTIITASSQSFQSTYFSGNWSGELQSYMLDPDTGALRTPAQWSAQAKLDALAASARKIASYSCNSATCQGVQFQPTIETTGTTLSSEQQALLSTTDGAGIVKFIRGDRSGEMAVPATATEAAIAKKYRQRASVLGDIVNSEPVVVGAPSAHYSETTDPGYGEFKTSNASRTVLVFQGANDGMLHAFKADSGDEAWAYVPSLLLPTLANLSLVSGFTHKYYVDGTPTVGDVDFDRSGGAGGAGTPNWRTILVGGLGKGGRGYYALDVTNAIPDNEAAAAAKVLWEFPNASTEPQVVANLGYSFGKPIIAKAGDQGWVVLVTSGYNNIDTVTAVASNGVSTTYTGDGDGHLFVLNARTGEVIKDIPTLSGSNASPSGLAAFSGYIEGANVDNSVTLVYAGDLNGDVWRFALTGESGNWNVSKLAKLVDASDNVQPVTTAPELATIFESNAAYRFVYVGTGRYLGDSDVESTATQTMYGLIDDLSVAPLIDPLRSSLQRQALTPKTDPKYRLASAEKFDLSGVSKKRGWYVDLPVSGERVSTDPQLAFGALVFTSNVPSAVKCVPGGSSYFNILDYRTGGVLDGTSWSSLSFGNALASRPVLERLESGKVIAVIRLSDGTTRIETVPAPAATPSVRRVSWRELPDLLQ